MPSTAALDAVRERFARRHVQGAAPSTVYGVLAAGGLVDSGGFGAADAAGTVPGADTAYRIASVTKSFTAASLLLLRDRRASGARRADHRLRRRAGRDPPADPRRTGPDAADAGHDVGRVAERRPVGGPPGVADRRRARRDPAQRDQLHVGPRHRVRVLEPRLRAPRAGDPGRLRAPLPRRGDRGHRAPARDARHRVRRRRPGRGRRGHGLRPARRGVGRAAVQRPGRVLAARRPVQHRARPGDVDADVRRRAPRSRRRAAVAGQPPRDAAAVPPDPARCRRRTRRRRRSSAATASGWSPPTIPSTGRSSPTRAATPASAPTSAGTRRPGSASSPSRTPPTPACPGRPARRC